MLHKSSLLRLAFILGVCSAERWSRQVPQAAFLPHQINDWIPLSQATQHSDRALRLASFPAQTQYNTFNQAQSPVNFATNPFGKLNYNVQTQPQTPVAQPLLQQTPNFNQQQLQSVDQAQDDVQLLYVPLETLNQQSRFGNNRYNVANLNAALINDNFYDAAASNSAAATAVPSSRFAAPITTTPRPNFNSFGPTAKPDTGKLKPYQPPLAIFKLNAGPKTSLNDVLSTLKAASTIDVLDAPSDKRPDVFIGPHDMAPPQGYAKFDLPYLSNLDVVRTGRKIDSLPFFVAPLSYNTPPGFAKIPLPAPHVGSVVVNTPLEQQSRPSTAQFYTQPPKNFDNGKNSNFGFGGNFVERPQASSANRFAFNNFLSTSSPELFPPQNNQFSYQTSPKAAARPSPRPTPSQNNFSFSQGSALSEDVFNTDKSRQPARGTKRPDKYQEPATEAPRSTAQPQPSSVSYQTAPSRAPSFFDNFNVSPSSTPASQSFFSSFGSDGTDDNFNQFVHKFKLVDSVKPNYKATKEPDFYNFDSNPFSFGSPVRNPPQFNPSTPRPPADRPLNFNSPSPSPSRQPPQKPASVSFDYPSSTVKPVVDTSSYDVTTAVPTVYTPTSFLTSDGSPLNINGQSPASVHYQNLQSEAQTEYNPYKAAITDKPQTTRGNNYRRPTTSTFEATTQPSESVFGQNRFKSRPTETVLPDEISQNIRTRLNNYEPVRAGPTRGQVSYDTPSTLGVALSSTRSPEQIAREQAFRAQEKLKQAKINAAQLAANQILSGQGRQPVQSQREQFERPKPRQPAPTQRPTVSTYETRRPTTEEIRRPLVQDYRRPVQDFNEDIPLLQNEVKNEVPSTYQVISTTQRPSSEQVSVSSPEPDVFSNVHEVQKDHIQLTQEYSPETTFSTTVPTTEAPIAYNTPSELPAISPMLPGLINSLPDDKWMNQPEAPKEEEKVTTRRPFRGRRPVTPRTQTSDSEASNPRTRRPVPSATRYTSRNEGEKATTSDTTTSTRGQSNRGTAARNPNRVRYNPTPEERQRLRGRTRSQIANKPAVEKDSEKDLEYQRDVLNQNYPVIKPRPSQTLTTRSTTTAAPITTPTTTTEAPQTAIPQQEEYVPDRYNSLNQQLDIHQYIVQNEQLDENLPQNHANNYRGQDNEPLFPPSFSGIPEEMQVPQEVSTTFDEEPITESIEEKRKSIFNRNKINISPIYTTARPSRITTTTTEAPQTTTATATKRRPNFSRRQPRPTSSTTVTTTEGSVSEEPTARPRRPVLRVRQRPTTTVAPNEVSSRRSYQSYASQNELKEENEGVAPLPRRQNFPSRTTTSSRTDQSEQAPFRGRQRSRFRLDTQESQWSTPLDSLNSFQPIKETSARANKQLITALDETIEQEPEIITAGPEVESENKVKNEESFDVKVETDLNSVPQSPPAQEKRRKIFVRKRIVTTAAPIEEIVDENKEQNDASEVKEEEKKVEAKQGKRRGYWKKIRVRPADTFETAESQHIGNHYLNALLPEIKSMEKHRYDKDQAPEIKFNLEPESTQTLPLADESETVRSPKKTEQEQVEVINWSRDTAPEVKVTDVPRTERPLTTTVNVEDLNKDDEENNKSSEEEESITTIQPTDEGSIEVTTVPVPTRQTTEDTSMFDEVKKSLTELFGMNDNDDDEEPADQLALEDHEEQRSLEQEEEEQRQESEEAEDEGTTLASSSVEAEINSATSTPKPVEVTTEADEASDEQEQSSTTTEVPGKNPMGSLVLATSTSRQISHETEICYRGRCIKTDRKKLEK